MEILGVLLGLVNNYGRHKALPISSFEYKWGAPEWCALSSLYLPHYFPLKELLSTYNLFPFIVGVNPNLIKVSYLSGSCSDRMDVRWDDRSYLESKLVLMIFMWVYCCSSNLVRVFVIWHAGYHQSRTSFLFIIDITVHVINLVEHLLVEPWDTFISPPVAWSRNIDCSCRLISLFSLFIFLLFIYMQNYSAGIPDRGICFNAVVGILTTHIMHHLL